MPADTFGSDTPDQSAIGRIEAAAPGIGGGVAGGCGGGMPLIPHGYVSTDLPKVAKGSQPVIRESKKTVINRFPLSDRSRAFLKKYYPDATVNDWNDWKWQVRNRIRKADMVEKF